MGERPYFEGWYLKHQNEAETVAFIPALHRNGAGETTASLQIITGGRTWRVDYPGGAFTAERSPLRFTLGENWFSPEGCHIDCAAGDAVFRGDLRYGPWTALHSDIMGPFRFAPGMECRHSVLSLRHTVDGTLTLGGERLEFRSGVGYAEGDRGVSFPRRYLWTQCGWEGNCVMLSVAEIPFWGLRFTGCIASVLWRDREYRLATYRGVKLLRVGPGAVSLRQGGLTLDATLLEGRPQPLRAPQRGSMERTIHESAACRVRYRMAENGRELFDLASPRAGFESAWAEEGGD